MRELSVMSYNIRCDIGTTLIGEPDYWPRREFLLTNFLSRSKPDILGLQELMEHQIPSVLAGLGEGYAWIGEPRDTSPTSERSAVFYNKQVVEFMGGSTLALSDTPDKLGSITWGNKDPRIVTTAQFRHKDSGRLVHVFNTHLDHKSAYSRLRAAEYLTILSSLYATNILMGDFNAAAERSEPYGVLTEDYMDTYLSTPNRINDWGTFNRYKEPVSGGDRLDWILCTKDLDVERAGTDAYNLLGEYPSDHLPVVATIRL